MAALTAPSCPILAAPSLWGENMDAPLSALTATTLLPPLTEQGDALTVARGRVGALHARLARVGAGGTGAAGGTSAAAAGEERADTTVSAQCQRAPTIAGTMTTRPS